MAEYISVKDFLELFSVDCSRGGAKDFIDLTELYALCLAFPEYEVSFGALLRRFLKERKLSPLVFWSRIKRDVKEILEADDDTLDALGVELPPERNGADLSKALAAALSDVIREGDPALYLPTMEGVARRCLEK